jgi:predicted amidohydrolase
MSAPAGRALFHDKIDAIAAEAAAGAAGMLVLPEYASMELAACLPGAGDAQAELQAVAAEAPALLGFFRDTARRHKLWLLPGTLPVAEHGRVVNRAPLIDPGGRVAFQDKTTVTRFEAESWGVSPGAPPRVFATDWGSIGIAICYDIEFPPLVRAQVCAGAWLILAPSCTETAFGFNRVRLSARARALENQCFVATTPTVGPCDGVASVDANHGYAGVYGPVDGGFPEDGILARGPLNQPGLVWADLDRARLDAVRADGAVRNHRDWPVSVPACTIATPED